MEFKDVVFIAAFAVFHWTFVNSLLALGDWFLDRTVGPVDTDGRD